MLLPDGTRRYTDVGLNPNSSATRAAVSRGFSQASGFKLQGGVQGVGFKEILLIP